MNKNILPVLLVIVLGLLAFVSVFYRWQHTPHAASDAIAEAHTTGQHALAIRKAIMNGDFQDADKALNSILAMKDVNESSAALELFLSILVPYSNPEFLAQLDKWVAEESHSALPLIVRSEYYYNTGLVFRGKTFVDKIPPDRMAIFGSYMAKAWKDIWKAREYNPNLPYIDLDIMAMLQHLGAMAAEAETFKSTVARYPDYYPIYDLYLSGLAPKWNGSVTQMVAFASKYASHPSDTTSFAMLAINLYLSLANDMQINCSNALTDAARESCVTAIEDYLNSVAMQKMLKESLRQAFKKNPYMLNELIVSSTCADCTHLNIQQLKMFFDLAKEVLGADNYAIDFSYGYYYAKQKDNTRAIDYYKKSLKDMEVFHFPSDEARDRAMAVVYKDLSIVSESMHDYNAGINYGNAAVEHDDTNETYRTYLCQSYVSLNRGAKAVESCTAALAIQKSGVSLNLRAVAYMTLQKMDEAMRDFEAALKADDIFRQEDRGRIIGQLLLLYKITGQSAQKIKLYSDYPYLLDPDNSDVAEHLADRCDAYSKLNNYRKALVDCDASLAIKPSHEVNVLRTAVETKLKNNSAPVSALMAAIDAQQDETVKKLVEQGADIDEKNAYKRTPLMEAFDKRNWPVAEFLIEHGADFKKPVDDNGEDTLYHAVENTCPLNVNVRGNGHFVAKCPTDTSKQLTAIVDNMLRSGANTERYNNLGETSFIIMAAECQTGFVKLMLDHGSETDQLDKETQETPIEEASENCGPDMISLLLQYHPNLSHKDGADKTALDHALKHNTILPGGPEVVKLLQKAK